MNIVMIPFHDYKKWLDEGFRTRDAHLCQHFCKMYEIENVLVINRPTSLAERVFRRKSWKINDGKILYCHNGIQLCEMENKVYCLDIKLNDFLKVLIKKKKWWFSAFNNSKVIGAINEAIRYLNMEHNVLLLQNPMSIGAAKGVITDKFVFDAIDNWIYHPQMRDKELIKANYEYVDKNACMILTVSAALKQAFPINRNVYWIPNGVDVEYFRSARKKSVNSKMLIAGYVGKIQERVDFDLIEKCLQNFKHVQFEFLGPVYAQTEKIRVLEKKYSNIKFRGDIHYGELPKKMKEFDVCIMPHSMNEFTSSMNPLKLYEYLAAGKPVVSTNVAGIEGISEYVYNAGDSNEFVEKLKEVFELIISGKINFQDIVDSIPKECHWEYRSDEIVKLINL